MNLIRNKGFRVFLYILGYVSAAAVIALSIVSAMRYSVFENDIDTAKNFAETESIRYSVLAELNALQATAENKTAMKASGMEDLKLNIVDYSTGEQKEVPLEALPKSEYFTNTLEGLRYSANKWGYDQVGEYAYPELPPEAVSSAPAGFLLIGLNNYLSLIREHCYAYSRELQELYFSNPYLLSEEQLSHYEKLINSGFVNYMDEGDYFTILENGVFVYSPGYQFIRKTGQEISLVPAIDEKQDLYIALPKTLNVKKAFSGTMDDETVRSILSGNIYTSAYDACYATLNSEQRELVRNSAGESSLILFANCAVNYEGDTPYAFRLQDPNCIIQAGDLTVYENSYSKLADVLPGKSDIFIRYDKKTGELTQWYKDAAGTRHDFAYITDLQTLPQLAAGNFVLGLSLYTNPMRSLAIDELTFTIAKAVPSPALFLVISAVIFLLCVILILAGEPAKLRSVDRIPFEIFLLGCLVLLFLFGFYFPRIIGENIFTVIQKDLPALAGIVLAFILVLYLITAGLFTTITRRIKCHGFLKTMLLPKLLKQAGNGLKWAGRKISLGWRRLRETYRQSLCGHKRLILFASVLFTVNAIVLLLYGLMHEEAVLFSFLLVVAEAIAGYQLIKYSAGAEKVLSVSRQIEAGDLNAKTDPNELRFNIRELGESLNQLGTGLSKAVESSIRDERTKAELITNVSHDIKTPLTSIISYVDLLKNEPIDNERAKEYIRVLDQKSQRLKQLIMDLIEVSKTNTGNIELDCIDLNLAELLDQVLGEYEDKMASCSLEPVKNIQAKRPVIHADGRRIFRIIDNILNNTVKYAQPGTRVYIDLTERDAAPGDDAGTGQIAQKDIVLSVKNVSREMLNISAEELTERFVRGDRSRHTEGSGLGLSIARNLTELQGGSFKIEIDGDLFKVEISFPAVG